MGFLRFYLALCVVQAHTGNFLPWDAPRGRHAVAIFFMVSGFYMAMVLSGRYARVRDFYESRWMRIAVPYYFHLAVIVVLSVLAGLIWSRWLALEAFAADPLSRNGLAGILLVATSNLTIFGQDLALFFRDQAGQGLQFTPNFAAFPDPLYRYLVIPQCWSVAIELVFYLLAPFLNRLGTWTLVGIVGVSSIARLAAFWVGGMGHDPWVYRFLPFELGFFVAGMVGWRMLAAFENRRGRAKVPRIVGYGAICVAIVVAGVAFRRSYQWFTGTVGEATASFIMVLSALPVILLAFHLTRAHHFDRLVGELSYPIYLNHLFIIVTLRALPVFEPLRPYFGVITGLLSILLAWAFWKWFLGRFEEKRHRTFGLAPLPT